MSARVQCSAGGDESAARPHSHRSSSTRSVFAPRLLPTVSLLALASCLIPHLSPRVSRVSALVRRELPLDYFASNAGMPLLPSALEKIVQTVVPSDGSVPFASPEPFRGHDIFFSTFGSTRSAAGSKEEFERIERLWIEGAAKQAREAGINQFELCSSASADVKSSFNYLRVKGEIESRISESIAFPEYAIYRPGLLLTGEREGPKRRWGEWFAQKIIPAFHRILPEKSCGVYSQTLAEAMLRHAEYTLDHPREGEAPLQPRQVIFENDHIRAMDVLRSQ
jgi:hypothetical protein